MKIKVKEIAQVLVALPQNVKKGERGRAQWLKPGNIFEDNHFDKIIQRWQLGLRFRLLFITLKAFQKFLNFKSLTTLDK